MKGKRLVIASPIANEIIEVAKVNGITTTEASKIVFLGWFRRGKRKSFWSMDLVQMGREARHQDIARELVA